ncbi:chaperone protein dnaJ 8, chloroplastic-like [Dorcoceras hygrometricum]|uniref:Chaperone protein dnaJ 8, chloroplastic-like n=1 Tax=Dorcoceras hygrometricum TaxID=472368 RepID=A0A2Z7AKL9_9LAMI|nr:chaperone protein dnaJ 8, chloroplastic-like [Dorcoceras hygrometricum]
MAACSVGSNWIILKNSSMKTEARNEKKNGFGVSCVSSSSSSSSSSSTSAVSDPYKTLRIQPGASRSDVKKAFRKLALQYHPDVCRESNCTIQFQQINEAYDAVMSSFRDESSPLEMESCNSYEVDDDSMRGLNDQDWDLWEEWMGWEGAGIRDYSSHINPYI